MKKPTHMVEETTEIEHSSEYQIYNCRSAEGQPSFVEPLVQGAPVSMEVDTGASLSIISLRSTTLLGQEHNPHLSNHLMSSWHLYGGGDSCGWRY